MFNRSDLSRDQYMLGPRQLPKLGRIFGKSIGKAKKAIDELEEE